MIKRGFEPGRKPKPVSYTIRKGYTDHQNGRYKIKTGKFKTNHPVESAESNGELAPNIK